MFSEPLSFSKEGCTDSNIQTLIFKVVFQSVACASGNLCFRVSVLLVFSCLLTKKPLLFIHSSCESLYPLESCWGCWSLQSFVLSKGGIYVSQKWHMEMNNQPFKHKSNLYSPYNLLVHVFGWCEEEGGVNGGNPSLLL